MRLAQRLAIKYIRTKFRLLSAVSKRKAAEKAFQMFCTPQSRVKKKLPPIFEKAEKLHFSFEGNTIRGFRWNHQKADKKVLILHGFESSVVNFDHYVKPLLQKGYEVLAFDAPAHGLSSGKTITVLVYKNLIHHIDKTFGPVTSFVSHSFGGLAVSLFLEEIKHDQNYKLVLMAPATETQTAANHFFKFLKLDGEVRKEFDDFITETGGNRPEWYSVSRAAAHIKAQVLFLQDRNDEITPLQDVEPIIKKKYPNFQFIISEGLGHSKIYRDHQSIKEVVDFL